MRPASHQPPVTGHRPPLLTRATKDSTNNPFAIVPYQDTRPPPNRWTSDRTQDRIKPLTQAHTYVPYRTSQQAYRGHQYGTPSGPSPNDSRFSHPMLTAAATAAPPAQSQHPVAGAPVHYPAHMHPRGHTQSPAPQQSPGQHQEAPRHRTSSPSRGGYPPAQAQSCIFCGPRSVSHTSDDCWKRSQILEGLKSRPDLMRMPPHPGHNAVPPTSQHHPMPPRIAAASSVSQPPVPLSTFQLMEEAGFLFPPTSSPHTAMLSSAPSWHSTATQANASAPPQHPYDAGRADPRSAQDVRMSGHVGVTALRGEDIGSLISDLGTDVGICTPPATLGLQAAPDHDPLWEGIHAQCASLATVLRPPSDQHRLSHKRSRPPQQAPPPSTPPIFSQERGTFSPRIPQYAPQHYGESFEVAPPNSGTALQAPSQTTITVLPQSFPQNPVPSLTPTGTPEPESFQPYPDTAWASWHTALDLVSSPSCTAQAPQSSQPHADVSAPGTRTTLATMVAGENTDTVAYFQQAQQQSTKGVLRYFLNDPSDPTHNVSVIYNGTRTTWAKTFMDDGANVDMIDDAVRCAMGVPLFKTNVTLSTSTTTSGGVLGVTAPLTIEYGQGPLSVRVTRPFLVSTGMRGIYDILISNRDTQDMHGIINAGLCTYTLSKPRTNGPMGELVLPTTVMST
jgi:hypothetical protein